MSASWRFEAIGTAWEIETAEPLPPTAQDAVAARIDESPYAADAEPARPGDAALGDPERFLEQLGQVAGEPEVGREHREADPVVLCLPAEGVQVGASESSNIAA